MIVVYQMAKVASQSWVEAAKLAPEAEGGVPIHCHYAVPRNRELIQAVFALPSDRQTIANMFLPRNLLRVGASTWERMETARRLKKTIHILSGMRDPVARSISLIAFMSDFFGHVSRPLSPRVEAPIDYVIGALQENWRFVLERREPRQSFEWLLWYLTDSFRTWFADELGAALGVDVLEGKFQRQAAAQRMSTGEAEIFFYRVEDMTPDSPRYSRLLEEGSAFLEIPLASLPSVNTSTTRRSRELSLELRRRFWLPDDMLDAIYAEPVVQHFYDPGEVLAFKRRWGASGPPGA